MKHTALLIIALPLLLFPVRTQFFSSSRSDFYDRGNQESVAVDQRNAVTLSPKLTKIAGISNDYVWRLAADERGAIYAATGHGGQIYRKEPSSDRFTEFAKIPEAEVTAIAVAGDGTVYAAGAPKAVLYRIEKNGEATAFKKTGDLYFWDIAVHGNDLYIAAGGSNGKAYRFSQRTFTEILSTKEPHITALHRDKKTGDLYAATEGKGMIYRIANGATTVLYTPPEDEVHALALTASGALIAGTSSREIDTKTSSADTKSAPSSEKKARRNSVYTIDPDGVFDRMYTFSDTVILSLFSADNGIYIGTGDKGELYRLENNVLSLIAKLDAKQILTFVEANGALYCATGNAGNVYRVDVNYSAEGSYTSDALDAGNATRWGSIAYKGTIPPATDIFVETRSGNCITPDATWSAFVKANPKIESPSARFIQFKMTLKTSDPRRTPVIESFTMSYVQKNAAPEVNGVSFVSANQQLTVKDAPKKPQLSAHQAMVAWTGYDANDDTLRYDVWYRREGERTFKLMKEDTADTTYVFDANKMPSGVYYFKVTASDRMNNDVRSARSGESFSPPAVLDRTSPAVKDFVYVPVNSGRRISFKVIDTLAPIASVRIAVDGGDWRFIDPKDGLYDETLEEFETDAPITADSFAVEAADAEGNTVYQAFPLR